MKPVPPMTKTFMALSRIGHCVSRRRRGKRCFDAFTDGEARRHILVSGELNRGSGFRPEQLAA
jgi:hypothetical protein